MIEQIIDKNKTVQTETKVLCDGIIVTYWNIDGDLKFGFSVMTDSEDVAIKTIKKVIDRIVSESHEHDSEWRYNKIEYDKSFMERYGIIKATVRFHIKDRY